MARWTASAKWAAGPALDGKGDMPLGLRLSEGLGITAFKLNKIYKVAEACHAFGVAATAVNYKNEIVSSFD